jgi:N6-adenosine-specific RNA methylase IME4
LDRIFPVYRTTRANPQTVRSCEPIGREAASMTAPLPIGPFGVVYADPGWRWKPWSGTTGAGRSAENHYRTEPLECIKALEVPADKNCALLLWATSCMLPQALEVMPASGFAYRSQCIWVKPSIGLGYWWRCQHELLLLGIRGRVPAPPPGVRVPSVILAPRRRHSEKPEGNT